MISRLLLVVVARRLLLCGWVVPVMVGWLLLMMLAGRLGISLLWMILAMAMWVGLIRVWSAV
ncbi:hypothetical protein [Corynebacterium uberis]|uniref:hypothetical protein n=1 Tax=Corynebacterium uberis TaxID=2883169 RepID=UPI001D0A9586|nr:hypothetical protein [Corynebacterium uberis]UDL78003.1 hypothetical protein LH394_11320 [Corynebacterium uberis]UDL82421.1 hypothetical protein LH395_11330 [Corynebacterium uberis]